MGISSFQGLKTYTPRKDSTNIWKTHVLPYHLLLQVPSRPIPANKASSAQSLVPFAMSDSCTVDRGFDSKKMYPNKPGVGRIILSPKQNEQLHLSGEVVRCCHHGPGRMGCYTNKAIRCFSCRNRVSKTHVWSGTVRQWPPQSQNNSLTQKKHGTTNESQQMHYIIVEICIVPTKRDFPPALHFKGVSSWQFFGSEGLQKHCNDEIMEAFENF